MNQLLQSFHETMTFVKNWFSKDNNDEAPAIIPNFMGMQEWPGNVMLYKNTKEQELLPEVARYNIAETLLAVHELKEHCQTQRLSNAEHMCRGSLPFFRIGDDMVPFESSLQLFSQKGYTLSTDLPSETLIKGIISLIKLKLEPIEQYYTWIDPKNYEQTRSCYESEQPEPLRSILLLRKRRAVAHALKCDGWMSKPIAEITTELRNLFKLFTDTMGNNQCLFDNQLTEADVYLYGHLQAILNSKQPNSILLNTLNEFKRLKQYCLIFNQVHLRNQSIGIWEFV